MCWAVFTLFTPPALFTVVCVFESDEVVCAGPPHEEGATIAMQLLLQFVPLPIWGMFFPSGLTMAFVSIPIRAHTRANFSEICSAWTRTRPTVNRMKEDKRREMRGIASVQSGGIHTVHTEGTVPSQQASASASCFVGCFSSPHDVARWMGGWCVAVAVSGCRQDLCGSGDFIWRNMGGWKQNRRTKAGCRTDFSTQLQVHSVGFHPAKPGRPVTDGLKV